MVWTVRCLQNCQVAPKERIGLGVTVQAAIGDPKAVQTFCNVGVCCAESRLANSETALQVRYRIGISPALVITEPQAVKTCRHAWVISAECRLEDRDTPLEKQFGVSMSRQTGVNACQRMEPLDSFIMIGATRIF